MLLQTNSYIVPKDKRSEHARLLRKFRQTLHRLGCDSFEVYEQVGSNWAGGEATGRFVQIMRFRDRQHQQDLQAAEKQDPAAQQLIADFCALINFPYQQQQGLFAVGFYTSALPVAPFRPAGNPGQSPKPPVTPQQPEKTTTPGAPVGVGETPETAESTPGGAAPPHPQRLHLPEPAAPQKEGSSLLDFAALSPPSSAESTPLRLTSDFDGVVESDFAQAGDAEPAPNGVEGSSSPAHTGSFSDAPEAMLELVHEGGADEELITDADREAILSELTDEDVEIDGARQKTEG